MTAGAAPLARSLGFLAAQTLPREEFEVVVARTSADADPWSEVSASRHAHPDLRLRVVESSHRDPGSARNVALAAARGNYATFVDAGDEVGPTHLESLSSLAADDAVVLAARASGGAEQSAKFSDNVAKLVSTSIARSVSYDAELRRGQDEIYWLELVARHCLRWLTPSGETQTYVRSTPPGGEDRPGSVYEHEVGERIRYVARLQQLMAVSSLVAEVADDLLEKEAGPIAAYLRRCPEDHPRLVDDVTASALLDFPWSRVNEGLARDLAVCYCFPPFQDTSGMVAAKRLRARGLVTDVISQDLGAIRPRDPGSVRVAEPIVGRRQLTEGRASMSEWSAVSDFADKSWAALLAWEAEQGAYRSVYSRAVAMSSHFAAALIKLRRPDILWVAEFSDPLKIGATGDVRPGEVLEDWLSDEIREGMATAGFESGTGTGLFDWVERVAYALADALVFTNENQMELMLGYCEDQRLVTRARSIATVEQHPSPPSALYDLAHPDPDLGIELDPAVVQLAYFGVFYITRDLGVVVRALGRLRQDERDRIHLHVFTNDPDALNLEVARAGLAGIVTGHPYVPVLEFLALTRRFDVLVVNDAATAAYHDVNPYLPSKLADYRGSGTPIWAIYEPGSVLSGMEFAHRSALGDVDGAVEVLRSLVSGRTPRSSVSSHQSHKRC